MSSFQIACAHLVFLPELMCLEKALRFEDISTQWQHTVQVFFFVCRVGLFDDEKSDTLRKQRKMQPILIKIANRPHGRY